MKYYNLFHIKNHITLMKKLIFFLMCFFPLIVLSQERTVTGRVTDARGEAVPGVNVVIKGTTIGAATNLEGMYRIVVRSSNDVLSFTFIGSRTQEHVVGDRSTINVLLEDETVTMEDVVVVGYGIQTKESAIGSIEQVSGAELEKTSQVSLSNALTGQVPGVYTVQASGRPGMDAATINIRGRSTWGNATPLILVDNVERNFNDIDPREIETISVLKDASATAVFGVRGANGVILITTKRGKAGKPKFSYSSEVTVKEPILNRNMFDSYTTGLLVNEAHSNDNNWHLRFSDEVLEHYRLQDNPYLYPNTDWGKEIVNDYGFAQRHNISMSAGNRFAKVFTSLSYLYDGDIFNTVKQPTYNPEFSYNRYNYRTNMDFNVTSTTVVSLDVGGNVSFTNEPFESRAIRIWRPMWTMGPMTIPVIYPAEALEMYPDPIRPEETGPRIGNTGVFNTTNPYVALNNSGSSVLKGNDFNSTLRLDQNLKFLVPGLSVQARIAFNGRSAFRKNFPYYGVSYLLSADGTWRRFKGQDNADPEGGVVPIIPSGDGVATALYKHWYYEGSVNYKNSFGRHNITGLFLANRDNRQAGAAFPNYAEGLAGRVTYNYDTRYLFEFNIGINGSEKFAPGNRYGVFPSFAVGYNLHHEDYFIVFKPIVNTAKVRYTYGEVGSDNASRWLYISEYVYGSTNAFGFRPGTATSQGRNIQPIVEGQVANTSARWERAIKENLGFEIGFLENDVFLLTVDLYNEKRDGILLSRQSLPSWFGVSAKEQNLGETESKGYEIDLRFTQRRGNGMQYWLRAGYNFNDNRVVIRDEPPYMPEYQKQEGKRIGQQFGYTHIGYIQNLDQRAAAPQFGTGQFGLGDALYIDFNGDGAINVNDKVPVGYPGSYPLASYNFSGGYSYKGFDMDVNFQGAYGLTYYMWDVFKFPLHRLSNHYFDYHADYWSPENRDSRYPAVRMDANRTHNMIGNTELVTNNTRNSAYLRIKTAQIGYRIPANISSLLRLDNARLYLQGTNLYTWAPDVTMGDPEAPENEYPLVRRFTLGLQISF
jgi:TonB-linked SusC/RagA family outer membrane protein